MRMYINTPVRMNNQKVLIIFVPGFMETAHTPLFVRTAQMISKQEGFTTVRLDGPSFYENVGGLKEASIDAQVQHIIDAVSHFRRESDRVVLVGHSMGAFVSLLADTAHPERIILWDPSLHPREIFASTLRNASQAVSSTLIKELSLLPDIESAAADTTCPVGIISAEQGAAHIVAPYMRHLPILLGQVTIPGADHNFSTQQHTSALVHETLQFIKKPSPYEDGLAH